MSNNANDDHSEEEDEEEEDEEQKKLYAELEAKYKLKAKEPTEKKEYDEYSRNRSRENTVDLSSLKLNGPDKNVYDNKKETSLKPVLKEFSSNENTEEQKKTEKKKKAQRKRRESENDRIREQEKREYYIGVYDSLVRLRERYYRVYLEKLTEQVEKQRREIKEKSQQLEDKLLRQTQPKPKKKLEHHTLEYDRSFLDKVAKSETYKLVGYEEKLRQRGKLRYQYDVEEFWRLAREDPDKFKEMLDREKIDEVKDPEPDHVSSYNGSHLSSTFTTASRQSSFASLPPPTMPHDFRPMTQIEESKEGSRPESREPQSWAVTAQFTAQNTHRSQHIPPLMEDKTYTNLIRLPTQSVLKKEKTLDPHQKARLAAKLLDEKFPQKELPPLSCFTLDLGDNGPTPEELLQQLQQERRQKERQFFVKRIRKMYHLSQANSASTQRILAKHGDDMELAVEGPSMETLLSSYDLYGPPRDPLTDEERELREKPWLRHLQHRLGAPLSEEQAGIVPTPPASEKPASTHRRASSKSKKSAKSESAPPPPALNLNSLAENSKTVEAKCLSTKWNNYLGVLRSVLAK